MRTVTVRTAIALMVLPWLLAVIAWFAGAFQGLVRQQVVAEGHRLAETRISWYGVPLLQYPPDLVLYQDLVHQLRPDVIIETGTHSGGLSIYLATLLEVVHPEGRVVTVDIDAQYWRTTLKTLDVPGRDRLLARIKFLEGSSTAPEIVQQIKAEVAPGKRVLVILDSRHTKDHVLEELRVYAPLVTVGSYVIVNDTYFEGQTLFGDLYGTLSAVKEYLAGSDQFAVDNEITRFAVTCAPGGFLKRVK